MLLYEGFKWVYRQQSNGIYDINYINHQPTKNVLKRKIRYKDYTNSPVNVLRNSKAIAI